MSDYSKAMAKSSKVKELSTYEELKRPLLQNENEEDATQSMIPEGLGSQHFHRQMMAKLKILKNTIDIIDESIIAIKYQTTFIMINQ